MLRSDVHAESPRTILREGLAAADEDVILVNPTRAAMRELIDDFHDSPADAPVRLLADPGPLKDLTDDFLLASIMADLVAEETLDLRTLDPAPRNSLVLTDDFVVSLVQSGQRVAGLTTTDDEFVSRTYEYYESRWQRAEDFSLRKPPLSHVRDSLAAEIGSDAVQDFNRMLDALDATRGDGEGLDEVTMALLVAAKNGELLYDISRWGEDIQLASKATFSRTKNRLEEEDLIDTEKVPIDVGRPRLRLLLADEHLHDADIEQVAEHAETELGGS